MLNNFFSWNYIIIITSIIIIIIITIITIIITNVSTMILDCVFYSKDDNKDGITIIIFFFLRGHGNESCNLIGSLPGQYFPLFFFQRAR